MITIFIIALLFYFIITIIFNDGKIDFSLPLVFFSFFVGFLFTLLLSVVLYGCGVGQYETYSCNIYESVTISNNDVDVIIYNYDDSCSYSIDNVSVKLYHCTFIVDGTRVIELQRWHYYNGPDWLLLLPIFESYTIHK